jgi:hypothetical protein
MQFTTNAASVANRNLGVCRTTKSCRRCLVRVRPKTRAFWKRMSARAERRVPIEVELPAKPAPTNHEPPMRTVLVATARNPFRAVPHTFLRRVYHAH